MTHTQRTQIHTLAKTIFALAATQNIAAKEAFAALVLNRLDYARTQPNGYWWGNSITQICEHLIANAPRPQLPPEMTRAAYACCVRIARRALKGSLKDPTGGATRTHKTYDYPAWARGLAPKAEHGGYLFYRL